MLGPCGQSLILACEICTCWCLWEHFHVWDCGGSTRSMQPFSLSSSDLMLGLGPNYLRSVATIWCFFRSCDNLGFWACRDQGEDGWDGRRGKVGWLRVEEIDMLATRFEHFHLRSQYNLSSLLSCMHAHCLQAWRQSNMLWKWRLRWEQFNIQRGWENSTCRVGCRERQRDQCVCRWLFKKSC